MNEDREILTFEEALIHSSFHFTHPNGLVAQVERGEKIDDAPVRLVETALRRIKVEWNNEANIPKEDVYFLWKILPFSRLTNCIILYQERLLEISHLVGNLSIWIHRIFASSGLSEENAIDRLQQHLIGTSPSFSIQLMKGKIDKGALEDLFDALDILEEAWKPKIFIPKKAANSIMSVQDIIWRITGLYTDSQIQELRVIEKQIAQCITQCLS